jgi:hypothetical protein
VREKRHWENQIVALGGANYRRNVVMLDDDGKEVPGTKGYKYATQSRLPAPPSSDRAHGYPDILGGPRSYPASASSFKAARRRKKRKTRR